jgi:RTX calcium-binding nonapeptide repeat (4 copies)
MATRRRLILSSLAAALAGSVLNSGPALALPTSVNAPTINFERDTNGDKPDGFTSVDNSLTHFSDSVGEDLDIADAGEENLGEQGLRVLPDDESALVMDFDVPMRRIRLVFGNDDPSVCETEDIAQLDVYRRASSPDEFASWAKFMNCNDEADQSLAGGGVTFRRAVFVYPGIDLIEVVDNIQLSPKCTIRGDNGPNRLGGNAEANSICGFGGGDGIIRARGGNDFIHAGRGNDFAHGGLGADTVVGAAGADTLVVADGGESDTIYGGAGKDTCIIDPADTHSGCEKLTIHDV